jgi:hypothetical protein
VCLERSTRTVFVILKHVVECLLQSSSEEAVLFTVNYDSMKDESQSFRKFVDSLAVRTQIEGRGAESVKVVEDKGRKFLTSGKNEERLFEVVGNDGNYSLERPRNHGGDSEDRSFRSGGRMRGTLL